MQGQNYWQWAKILDAGLERRQDEETVCFAYSRDRIAVAFPRVGVKVWLWLKGTNSYLSLLRTCDKLSMLFRHLATSTFYPSTECHFR
jgi:hypothetical protein